jgi:hypothetical protein
MVTKGVSNFSWKERKKTSERMVIVKGKLQQGNDSDGAEEVRALNAQPQSIIDHRCLH